MTTLLNHSTLPAAVTASRHVRRRRHGQRHRHRNRLVTAHHNSGGRGLKATRIVEEAEVDPAEAPKASGWPMHRHGERSRGADFEATDGGGLRDHSAHATAKG